MSLPLVAEIWNLVRECLPYDDREQITDNMVGIMMEHGYDFEEIVDAFDGDKEIKNAVKYYREESEDIESDYDEDDDDYDELDYD